MTYKVTLNSKVYEVEVEKGEAILLNTADILSSAHATGKAVQGIVDAPVVSVPVVDAGEVIVAPLPGTVQEVEISVGQIVTKGQLLFIIEAMKMENEIVAALDGTVAQVVAQKGDYVVTGATLAVLKKDNLRKK